MIDDSYFWNTATWSKLLDKILAAQPRSVGVTFFFPEGVMPARRNLKKSSLIDPRVIWLSRLDSEGRPIFPPMADSDGTNLGFLSTRLDDDRVIRNFVLKPQAPSMAVEMARGTFEVQQLDDWRVKGRETALNYRTRPELIPQLNFSDILSESFDVSFLKGKFIILGTNDIDSHLLRSPLGDMTRAQLVAVQLDNILNHRFIHILPDTLVVVTLLFILLICIWFMSNYPQSIAFVFLAWIAAGWTALSFWLFDTYNLWMPILAPVAQVVATYVVFLGYQLTLKESETWRLEQEKKYLSEIEQLKNNFVSLISHDLKTPIAKIQGICDRLLAQSPSVEIVEGLLNLRQESVELHRYIQSILKMSRVESRDFKVQKEAVDFNEIVENVLSNLSPLAEQKGISLTSELEPMFSLEIDGLLIQEVILNLIENAIKYSPRGGQVLVRSLEIENEVQFEVEDNGPGIPAKDHEKIFDKFYRSKDQEHLTKGTGLGLYLVKYFVELHGG
ncbi:MAG: CHASE2 domain-containing protein, partial [Bdellovibrionales bacterium]|nr:CHASE2 domain-containing protein [Bdellovibrionales bacterium]